MHRCYISPSGWGGTRLQPDAEEAHHLAHVLRVREGDVVIAFDGQGRRVQATVRRPAGGSRAAPFVLEAQAGTEQRQEAPAPLALYAAILKGQRMDLLVEKACELGATRIVPMATERSVVRLTATQAPERCARWHRIAVGAAKQCGEDWVPEVGPVQTLADVLREAPRAGLCLVGSLQPGAQALRAVLAARAAGGPVACLVGPEGDFTEPEYAACAAAGVVAVRLGPRVLRAETAAMFMLSALTALR